jgi:hypothetical protein
VGGEDAVNGGDARVLAAGGEEVRVVEDKRRGAQDVAPPRGEHGGAHGVLDGEAGNDVAEELVGEGADAVLAVVVVQAEQRADLGQGGAGEAVQDALANCVHGRR